MRVAIIGTVASSILGFRRDFIKLLLNRNIIVYAFALDYNDSTREEAKKLGVIPIDFSFERSGANPFSDIFNTFRLAKKIKKIAPDLVFSYFAKPVIFGTIAAALAGVKRRVGMLEGLGYVFTNEQGAPSVKLRLFRSIQIFLYRISLPLLHKIIFLNPDDPIDLIDKNKIKVREVNILGGIGLNLRDYPFSKPPVTPIRFLFIGRLLKEKGVNDFIEAAQIVHSSHPEAQFVILGDLADSNPGALSLDELEKHMNDGLIIYPGHVKNVVEWINQASVFVLPSYYREGVPRSTQEAMAVGRAIITTDMPGCRETVIDGANGFLIPPWAPEALADKMLHFIHNPEDITRMGCASHAIATEKFDAAIVNERLFTMLDLQ